MNALRIKVLDTNEVSGLQILLIKNGDAFGGMLFDHRLFRHKFKSIFEFIDYYDCIACTGTDTTLVADD